MRKTVAVLMLSAVFTAAPCFHVSAASGMPETNLRGLRVASSHNPPEITYADGTAESFPNDFIGLFINGSIIKNANIVMKNDRTLVPLRLISKALGAEIEWDSAARKVTITDGSHKVELVIGDKNPKLDGKVISIDTAPEILNDYTYVPLRFIAESLNGKVNWFDGKAVEKGDGTGVPQAHYVLRMAHAMVSRYPVGAKALTKAEAIEGVRDQLRIAYEKKFGVKFEPLAVQAAQGSEQDGLRYRITNLSVSSENDRFFIMPMVWDFLIDKYTGTVLVYYNGDIQQIFKFDPNSSNALAFAG